MHIQLIHNEVRVKLHNIHIVQQHYSIAPYIVEHPYKSETQKA
jgi:hypothetical protein